MYRKTIKYTDYHGQVREETFDFNLSDSEIIELEANYDGSITEALNKLSDKLAHSELVKTMSQIVQLSYGKISQDGRQFNKNKDVWNEFYQTEAYSVFFTTLLRNDQAAARFFEGIISNELIRDD